MKKVVLLFVFLWTVSAMFAASATWNYNTQTGNIGTTYNWIDASSGIELTLGDDARDNVTWPFDFHIYDDHYTGGTDNISVCSNGYMRFDGDANTSYSAASGYNLTSDATTLGQIICVGIQDCNVGDSQSHVYWNVTGTYPNRILTIEYDHLEIDYNDNLYASIEVQFYENDGKIVMLFGDDNITKASADQGIHSGVSGYFYKWGDVDTNTNQTWLELTRPASTGPGAPTNPNPANGAVNVKVDNNPDISWTNPSGAVYNEVYFGTDHDLVDNMDPSVKVLGDGSTLYTSYNQTSDLSYNTIYYWKVVEYDNTKASTEGPLWSFTTTIGPESLPYSTDFSSTTGWTEQDDNCTPRWSQSNTNSAGGSSPEMKADWEDSDPATARLVSPPIDSNGQTSLQCIFKHMYDAYSSGVTIKIQSSSDGVNWTDEAWSHVCDSNNIGPETVTTTITNNVGGTIYIAWVVTGNLYNFDHWYLDDVTIQAPPTCPDPSAQTESNISSTSADLDWTENGSATKWWIEWGPTGFTQGSGTTDSTTTKPYTLNGLSANTTYDWYVRADCDSAGTSSWVGPHTFTTLSECPDPSNQTESNITTTSADLNWTENGTATKWDIEWGPSGFTQGSGTLVTGIESRPYNLTGLNEATYYDWYVRADCDTSGSKGTSNWVGPHTFYTKKAPVAPPIYQDFESMTVFTTGGWTKENTNGDSYQWEQYTGHARSDTVSMGIHWNSSQAMDDWFFTQPLALTGGVTYVVDFYYACQSSSWSEKLNVYWGTDNNSAAMTNGPIFDNNNITNTDYKRGWGTFTPTTTGTYYIGFHGYSDADKYYLFVDDVTVRSNYVVTDDLEFSEVCDNKAGEAENTGFIEIFNRQPFPLTLGGDEIKMGTSPTYGDYTYTFPSGATIPGFGYYVIANGATLTNFNSAWGKSLTSDIYDSDGNLQITSGKAYAYNTVNNPSKSNIDNTPAVSPDTRIVRKRDGSWDTSTGTSDGTPGEISGNDEPLANVLVSFMATFQAHELTLTWTVSSQTNISQWNLYRNEEDNFGTATKIATINVEENSSNDIYEYTFTDQFNFVNNTTYYYWIESVDYAGTSELLGNTNITINENENPDAPTVVRYGLRNYPNPFNPTTTIEFAVKEAGKATLYIYNIKGQLVRKVNKGYINADKIYKYEWNGTDMNNREVGSGVYFYKLVTPKKTYTKKMLLLK